MTILVTGGYGFIGSHLVKELNDKGYKVLIYDLQTYATDYVDFEYGKPQWRVWGDILDVKKLNSVLKTHKICLLYTSPSPRDKRQSRMPSSA